MYLKMNYQILIYDGSRFFRFIIFFRKMTYLLINNLLKYNKITFKIKFKIQSTDCS